MHLILIHSTSFHSFHGLSLARWPCLGGTEPLAFSAAGVSPPGLKGEGRGPRSYTLRCTLHYLPLTYIIPASLAGGKVGNLSLLIPSIPFAGTPLVLAGRAPYLVHTSLPLPRYSTGGHMAHCHLIY